MSNNQQDKKLTIHFKPDDVSIDVIPGSNLLQAARAAGASIYAACGGAGTCGTCKVIIEQGEAVTTRTRKISDEEFNKGMRQACQTKPLTNLTVFIPVESRIEKAVLAREHKVAETTVAAGWKFSPPLRKCVLQLHPPTLKDNASDLSRLLMGLKQVCHTGTITVDNTLLRTLPRVLREQDWQVTATVLVYPLNYQYPRRTACLLQLEPGNTTSRHYSLAFDIGTTTVCGQLLGLNKGDVVADHIMYNGQIPYGADVISRINHSQKAGGLKELQDAVTTSMNRVIEQLLSQSGVKREDIGHIMLAGNTVMTHLLLGIDPKYLRLAPYVPTANLFPAVEAQSLGIDVPHRVQLLPLPAVASYIGGDIVAGVVGCGMHQRKEVTLFIDIGTNGQMVIGNSEWMATASCSAGPTFEGGGVKHGIIATEGAIEDVTINLTTFEPQVGTIRGTKPRGICGSGLINTVAELFNAGLIGQNGKFNHDMPTKRVRRGEDGYEYVLAQAGETQTGKDIVITEVDIDNLIRAKAAMYAGYQTLSKSVGISRNDIEKVIIAGAFGSHLHVEKSITIGLLPDLPHEKFIFIGNGSLLGARLTSFSLDLLDDVQRVAGMMTNIELSENNEFMNDFIAALFLPHTNAAEFPSVKIVS